MNKLLAITAIALLATIGTANATVFGDTTNNTATATATGGKGGDAKSTSISGAAANAESTSISGAAAGAIAGAKTGDSTSESGSTLMFNQDYESRPSAPGIALGGGTLPSSSSPGERNPCALVRGQNHGGGLGAGIANGDVSGGILAYTRGTSQGLKIMDCEAGEQQREMLHVAVTTKDVVLAETAKKMSCLQEFARIVLDKMRPGYCDGLPTVGTPFGWTDDEEGKKPVDVLVYKSNPAPVVAKAPVVAPAPQPVAAAVTPSKPDFASCKGSADETACLNRKSRG